MTLSSRSSLRSRPNSSASAHHSGSGHRPLKDYFSRQFAFTFLLLIILYKLADAYASSLMSAFLIRGIGFSATDVGTINKGLGLVSTILGAFWAVALWSSWHFPFATLFRHSAGLYNTDLFCVGSDRKKLRNAHFRRCFEILAAACGTAAFYGTTDDHVLTTVQCDPVCPAVIACSTRRDCHCSDFRLCCPNCRLACLLPYSCCPFASRPRIALENLRHLSNP